MVACLRLPLVAVMKTVYALGTSVDELETANVEFNEPLVGTLKVVGLRVVVGPPGRTDAARVTAPEKLFIPVTVTVAVPEVPRYSESVPGLNDILKSGPIVNCTTVAVVVEVP
jgi:hypothetical protein